MRRLALLIAGLLAALNARAYEPEEHEEESAATFAALLNPRDDIYGASFGQGVWLKGAPVFGDYFLSPFWNGLEDAWYSGVGMTIRLMPRWALAPFAGGGGSYNYSLNGDRGMDEPSMTPGYSEVSEPFPHRGESYWGGHVECGMRLWMDNALRLLEVNGRYTWSSHGGEADYWLVGVSVAAGI